MGGYLICRKDKHNWTFRLRMTLAAKNDVDLDFLTVQLYNTISFEKKKNKVHLIENSVCIACDIRHLSRSRTMLISNLKTAQTNIANSQYLSMSMILLASKTSPHRASIHSNAVAGSSLFV
jgi:hypothetical protein